MSQCNVLLVITDGAEHCTGISFSLSTLSIFTKLTPGGTVMSKVVSNESSPSFFTVTSTFNFSFDPSKKDSVLLGGNKIKIKHGLVGSTDISNRSNSYGLDTSRRFGIQILSPPQFFCMLIESLDTANSSLSRSMTGVGVFVNRLSSMILYLSSASNGVNLSLTLF